MLSLDQGLSKAKPGELFDTDEALEGLSLSKLATD